MNYNSMVVFTVAITLIFGLVLFFQKQTYRKQLLKMEENLSQLKEARGKEFNEHLWQQMEVGKMILLDMIRQERQVVRNVDDELLSRMKIFFFEGNGHPFNWEIFYQIIDKIYDGALGKITQDYPKLSSGQKQFCGLLLAKFNDEEMAFIANIYPTSIRMRKLMVKQVLRVPKDRDLADFIIFNAQKSK